MITQPLTLKELNEATERIAFARCVCKGIRYPNERTIQDEVTQMTSAMARPENARPELSNSDAAAWLKKYGYDVPKAEKKSDYILPVARKLPTSSKG